MKSVTTSGTNGDWIRDQLGTTSGSTGPNQSPTGNYYIYAETSSSGSPNKYFTLRTYNNLTDYLP